MRELACLNNVMPSTNTPAGRKNGGGGKENNVTEDSPRRGETNESGAQSLPNKTQEHRVLVPGMSQEEETSRFELWPPPSHTDNPAAGAAICRLTWPRILSAYAGTK
ncbi:hypothetical protein CABS02_09913 [Colletotrichum abscissum]|uniref:Uncharacterized protein n=1 Tax=Colletotrichum abscissum TaxID=1671311 RepID=A0A9Q0B1E3_9PEZI|nr:hypothetical protein CABS02_09913 [Colletotrichum abscissum]